jgi:biopolymer transport protein ExbD
MARKKEEAGVDVTLPITPMLDMSFQLLSFFVITFKPPSMEGQLPINLPKSDIAAAPTDPTSVEDPKDEYFVTIAGDTEIRALSIRGPTLTEKDVSIAGLKDELDRIAKAKAAEGAKNITITLESEDRLRYSNLMVVMDLCKKAGFEAIGLTGRRKSSRGG